MSTKKKSNYIQPKMMVAAALISNSVLTYSQPFASMLEEGGEDGEQWQN